MGGGMGGRWRAGWVHGWWMGGRELQSRWHAQATTGWIHFAQTMPAPAPSPPARLPAHSQGLAYGLSVAEAIVSPAMPSSTARAGGIFMPIISSLAHGGGSEPGEELLAGLGVGAKWLGIGQ